jgi:hypothetical protein
MIRIRGKRFWFNHFVNKSFNNSRLNTQGTILFVKKFLTLSSNNKLVRFLLSGSASFMKKFYFILLSLVLLSADLVPYRFEQDDTNAKIKAVFIKNFVKYIEWPNSYKEGNFIIGIYGTNPSLLLELNKMANSASVVAAGRKFEIRTISSPENAGKCHILFIPADNSFQLSEIMPKLKGKSTLIVTEKAGLAKQGAAINFVVLDNKQKFELNKANAERYNLKVSSNLATLAIVVD